MGDPQIGVSDAELVRRFQRGDSQAFETLVDRFYERVYRLAMVWLHDAQLAPDACQEVFLRGFKGLKGFRFKADPFTWLYRATRNVCNEMNRKKRPETLLSEPMDQSPRAEDTVDAATTTRLVRNLLSGLSARQREVVLLRIFEELSVEQTARAMGCRPGTVKALLHKALGNLRVAAPNDRGPVE